MMATECFFDGGGRESTPPPPSPLQGEGDCSQFWNNDVLDNIDGVLNAISTALLDSTTDAQAH
jgi:hypothetical protein